MADRENIGSFIRENKKLVKSYFETRAEIYRLKAVRLLSKTAGYLIWIIISLFLALLFIIFLGIVASLWLSEITGSYLAGFSITSLGILVIIIVLALLRRVLFVNPIIKAVINHANEDKPNDE
ncbi:MAG: hypothetical protein JJE22_06785 [Bacteroidia bacterium]|nr:hypothetical protein [Bacteroidia bacterium]